MKPLTHWAVALTQLLIINGLCHAADSVHYANTLTIELEGRGLYQEATVAPYSDKFLTLEAPTTGWLSDMKRSHLLSLKDIDLNDLTGLAALLSDGVQHTTVPTEISVEYSAPDGKTIKKVLPVSHVGASSGNMQYVLAESIGLPQEMENVTLLIKTWPVPTEQAAELMLGGRGPTKAVCCDCSGGCAALWIMFGYCKSCMTALGGEYCCSECHKPAAPSGSCP